MLDVIKRYIPSALKKNLVNENFTNSELFSELAVYFSDNMLNMFKLLDNLSV